MSSRTLITASVMLAAGVSHMVGCRDTPTTVKAGGGANVRITAAAAATRARVHKRNPHEWVGTSHNKSLDDWRKEMRKPGVLTHNLCGYVTDFATRDERLPAGKQTPLPSRRRAISAAIKESNLCRSLTAPGVPSSLVSRGSLVRNGSEALVAIQSQIEDAVTVAENSYDLAGRLNSVLDAAAALQEPEQAVALATLSVAQNSFEYWESQYPAVVREIENEYSTCASDRQSSGYGMDAARASCLSGETYDVMFRGFSPNALLGPTVVRGFSTSLRCGPSLGEGFRHVARSDARGAFSGAFAGMLGGAAGVVGGALAGGTGASVWAAGENAWATFWCIMLK